MRAENAELRMRVEGVERKMDDLSHKDDIVEKVKAKVMEELREEEDRKSRQNNVVLFLAPESLSEDSGERMREDRVLCEEVFDGKLGCNVSIVEVVRIGKHERNRNNNVQERSKPRPLLVKLENRHQKYEILKNAKKLSRESDDKYRRIYIGPDQTQAERESSNRLRGELRRRREEGQTGWLIRRGRLVRSDEERPGHGNF